MSTMNKSASTSVTIDSVTSETLVSEVAPTKSDTTVIANNKDCISLAAESTASEQNDATKSCSTSYTGWSDNDEPRMFDQEKEEKGCKEIVNALTYEELEAMPDQNMPLRHLRADKGDIKKAVKRIKHVIKWRQDFGVDKIIRAATNPSTNEEKEIHSILKHESSPGKMYVRNHDNSKRAILYMFPVKENTNHRKHNIMHLVYALERAIACTEKNRLEKMVIIMDFKNWKMKHSAPMATTKETIHILQECYVERMSRVYFTNAPLIFKTFWNMIKVFVDPETKKKIVFCSGKAGEEELKRNFDETKVDACALGTSDLRAFDVDQYFGTPFDETFDELP